MSDQESLAGETTEHMRIGIIGGTFDPIHNGHLALAEEIYHSLHLARVLFVPAKRPPHKMGLPVTPLHHRVAMLELAIASNPHFALSRVDMQRPGPSYTVDTVRILSQEWGPQVGLYFMIGSDSLRDLPTWYDIAGILAHVTIVALVRPGYTAMQTYQEQLEARLPGIEKRLITLEGPLLEISSTDLRQRVAQGRPVKYQIPEVVEQYILQQHLYVNDAGEELIERK